MAYRRKTKDEYHLQGDYGIGYETVTVDETMKESREMRKCYRENEPGIPFRIVKVRVRIAQ